MEFTTWKHFTKSTLRLFQVVRLSIGMIKYAMKSHGVLIKNLGNNTLGIYDMITLKLKSYMGKLHSHKEPDIKPPHHIKYLQLDKGNW